MNRVGFVRLGIVHIHPGHIGIQARRGLLRLRSGRREGLLRFDRGRVVTGHSGKQNGDNKDRANQYPELCGELRELAAGWHSNSPH